MFLFSFRFSDIFPATPLVLVKYLKHALSSAPLEK